MTEWGFLPGFSQEILDELSTFRQCASPRPAAIVQDMRAQAWISIDNDDSRDLDQLTFAQADRLFVAIADVDALVKKGSPIDQHAHHNTTSVYTPTRIFPMLPLKLSNDLTSLNQGADRGALVVEMRVGEGGEFELARVFPAWVQNRGKLTYNEVGAYLESKIDSPHLLPFKAQLDLQDDMAVRIQKARDRQGALHFAERELQPVFEKGVIVDLKERKMNRAHRLIENGMIAANVSVTHYLGQMKRPSLRRIVRTPKRWDRIVELARGLGRKLPEMPDARALRAFLIEEQQRAPDTFADLSLAMIKLIGRGEYVLGLPGQKDLIHFDLAEIEYAHTTAPNRRYPDLVMQRLLKGSLYGDPPLYSNEELASIAAHCTLKENDAAKVERRLFKCAAAMVMQKEIGHTFKAMVTGASDKGTWVRLSKPPIEGKLVRGFKGLDVGDYVEVKLIHVDIPRGYIDFSAG